MEQIYTVKEIAELFQMHPATIRKIIKSGKLRAEKRGGKFFITAQAWKEFVDDHMTGGDAAPNKSQG
jgi:excisionase family DNA binding protein